MIRILATSLVIFILLSLSFAYLSYNLNESVAQEKSLRLQAEVALSDVTKSLGLTKSACEITDIIVTDYTEQLKAADKAEKILLEKIVYLPAKATQIKQEVTGVQDNSSIDIDMPLPDSLTSVLRESYLQREGDTSPTP